MRGDASSERTFLGEGLIECHPVAIGLRVDQHSITVKQQGFWPASCRGLGTGCDEAQTYRKAMQHRTNLTSPHFATP